MTLPGFDDYLDNYGHPGLADDDETQDSIETEGNSSE